MVGRAPGGSGGAAPRGLRPGGARLGRASRHRPRYVARPGVAGVGAPPRALGRAAQPTASRRPPRCGGDARGGAGGAPRGLTTPPGRPTREPPPTAVRGAKPRGVAAAERPGRSGLRCAGARTYGSTCAAALTAVRVLAICVIRWRAPWWLLVLFVVPLLMPTGCCAPAWTSTRRLTTDDARRSSPAAWTDGSTLLGVNPAARRLRRGAGAGAVRLRCCGPGTCPCGGGQRRPRPAADPPDGSVAGGSLFQRLVRRPSPPAARGPARTPGGETGDGPADVRGVSSRPGASQSGWSAGGGSGSVTSSAARSRPDRSSASSRAGVARPARGGVDEQRAVPHPGQEPGVDQAAGGVASAAPRHHGPRPAAVRAARRRRGARPGAGAGDHRDGRVERQQPAPDRLATSPAPTTSTCWPASSPVMCWSQRRCLLVQHEPGNSQRGEHAVSTHSMSSRRARRGRRRGSRRRQPADERVRAGGEQLHHPQPRQRRICRPARRRAGTAGPRSRRRRPGAAGRRAAGTAPRVTPSGGRAGAGPARWARRALRVGTAEAYGAGGNRDRRLPSYVVTVGVHRMVGGLWGGCRSRLLRGRPGSPCGPVRGRPGPSGAGAGSAAGARAGMR